MFQNKKALSLGNALSMVAAICHALGAAHGPDTVVHGALTC